MKKIIISCILIIIAITSLYLLIREPLDRFNPLIKQEYVYVQVQGEPTDDKGRYKYRLQGVTESGETKGVVFTTSTRLERGTFLKVLAKGTYTEKYRFIDQSEMPSN